MIRNNIQNKVKVLSLFSGIGGLDIGYEKAGFDIVATLEWDKDCCETLRKNRNKFLGKDTKIIQADITKIDPKDIYDGQIDFFIGGPPCQTFSAIGRRAGGANGRLDDRGNLFKHYCRLLKHYSPKGFMFENVRGILSSNKGLDWRDILNEFSALGYSLKYRVLDTAGFGAPQHRERVILVGYKKDIPEFFFPKPNHGLDESDSIPFVKAIDAIRDVNHTEDVPALFNKNGKYDNFLKDVPPGMNYLFYTQEMNHPEPKFAWRSKFSDFLYKADPNLPVKTIVASMGRYSGPFHWDSRRFSIGELLRLQGFPDGFELAGGRTSKVKQIGNSVIPIFAYPLALAVKKTIFNDASVDQELLRDDEVINIDRRKTSKVRNTRRKIGVNSDRLSLFGPSINKTFLIPTAKLARADYFITYNSSNLPEINDRGEYLLSINTVGQKIILDLAKTKQVRNKVAAKVILDINLDCLGQLKVLELSSYFYDSSRPYMLWDAINIAISSVSHYPSVHELYGHFTEPNPKFSIKSFLLPKDSSPYSLLTRWITDMNNTFNSYPLAVLEKMGFDVSNEHLLLKDLRHKRIDIRSNLTNRRIEKGKFRICYPYTLPADRKTFVTIGV